MVISELINWIQSETSCSYRLREGGQLPMHPRDWTHGHRLPEDVLAFYRTFQECNLLSEGEENWRFRNCWKLPDEPFYTTLNGFFRGEKAPDRPRYFDHCFLIAHSQQAGQEGVGIDLHPDRFGWMFFLWIESPWPAEFPVIAHSFTEWLELTMKRGLHEGPYWKTDHFPDLGPANPEDTQWWPYRNVN